MHSSDKIKSHSSLAETEPTMNLYGVLVLAYCQVYPRFEHRNVRLRNNSYIHDRNFSSEQDVLQCTTSYKNCCNEPQHGNWGDEERLYIMTKEDMFLGDCFYITRERRASYISVSTAAVEQTV